MGFSAPTAPFRPSSLCPPYFWFCRSCVHFYSVSSSTRVFCRLEDKASQSAQRRIPNGAISADVLELNQKSSYSTFQHNDNQMRYQDRSDFAYRWKNSSLYREAEAIEDDGQGILEVLNTAQAANDWGHTIEDWGKATEECRKNKRLFAHGKNTSAKLKTNTGDNRRKTVVRYS